MRERCNRWYLKVIRPSTFSRFAGLGPRIFCSCNRANEDKSLRGRSHSRSGVSASQFGERGRKAEGSVLTEAAKRIPKTLPWPQKSPRADRWEYPFYSFSNLVLGNHVPPR